MTVRQSFQTPPYPSHMVKNSPLNIIPTSRPTPSGTHQPVKAGLKGALSRYLATL